MDKTILSRNSAELYIRWQRARGEATAWDQIKLASWLLQYGVGLLDAPRVARKLVAGYAGTSEEVLRARCREWFSESVRDFIAPSARRAVEAHKARGDLTAIVTASTYYASEPLQGELGLDLTIATELEIDEQGRLTGRYVEPLCYGEGKVERARRRLAELGYSVSEASFYSDSVTDLPLFEVVGSRTAVNPDRKLARIARARGWNVERW